MTMGLRERRAASIAASVLDPDAIFLIIRNHTIGDIKDARGRNILFCFRIAETRRLRQGEVDDLFACNGADVVVQTQYLGAGGLLGQHALLGGSTRFHSITWRTASGRFDNV